MSSCHSQIRVPNILKRKNGISQIELVISIGVSSISVGKAQHRKGMKCVSGLARSIRRDLSLPHWPRPGLLQFPR